MGELHEKTDSQLLRDYAEHADERAFHEVVTRYTDLVYSAAVRQVNSPDLAQDVAQSVFTDLARKSREVAAKAANEASLAGWLFRSTRFAALNQLRAERQRLAHERQIMDQLDLSPDSDQDWERIRPVLDEAIADLNDADRDALLLRFFKNRDFRAIGRTLGVSDDAAQKRVTRALDKLRAEFARRGVTTTVTALTAALSVNAVTAAPVGLASTFSATALAGAATVSTTAAATIVNTIAMTTLQKAVVATVLAAAVGAGLYQAKKASDLRKEVRVLQEQHEPLARQIAALEKERSEASNVIAALADQNEALRKRPTEVLHLKGEVGRLKTEKAALSRTTALSKMTETPEARKFMREQQKGGMARIYSQFAKDNSLPDDRKEALNDLLADHVMENIDLITTALRDKSSAEEAELLFAQSEADLKSKVESLLGPEAYPRYQEYTRDLAAMLTADQFDGRLTGETAEKEAKAKQLQNLMREEMRSVLASAGLPPDFQVVPILNFRNIYSEAEAERNLKLLDQIFAGVARRGGAFLSPEELNRFEEFRRTAIEQNRMALSMNRTMMAPIGQ